MRCPAHGLIEASTEVAGWVGDDATGNAVEHICPVSVGDGSTCGLTLDRAERLLAREDVERVLREERERARRELRGVIGAGLAASAVKRAADRLGLDIDNDGREDG